MNTYSKPGGVRTFRFAAGWLAGAWVVAAGLALTPAAFSATFPGNARVEIPDATGSLSWNTNAEALTVQCWFKLSVPTWVTLTENMTIVVNRSTSAGPAAYHIYYDKNTREIRFATGGTSTWTGILIPGPYMERWYHVAVVRSGNNLTAYVDGQVVTNAVDLKTGITRSTDGITIGSSEGNNRWPLYGEVQELSIYTNALGPTTIRQRMFEDQPTSDPNLRGYFKLNYAQTPSDRLRNMASAPAPNTDGTARGNGVITYEETSQAGEQSSFDANRNGGAGAIAPLSGAFWWDQPVLTRPTPGIPFELRIGYGSANAAGDYQEGERDPSRAGPLGNRWRHSFETRVIPSETTDLNVMMWNGGIETWVKQGVFDYRTRRGEYRGEFYNFLTNYLWVTPERLVYTFRVLNDTNLLMQGRLTSIRDPNHNEVRLLYDESYGRLTNIVDTAGGFWNFHYRSSDNLLERVSFGEWSVLFGYTNGQRLVSKTLTNSSGVYSNVNTRIAFNYYTSGLSSNLLQSIVDPMGRTNVLVAYDEYGRKTNTVNALMQTNRIEYGMPKLRQVRTTDAEGFQWINTHDRDGRVIAQRDPLGNETRSTYDTTGNLTSSTDARGHTSTFGYDARNNPVAQTNALGEVSRKTYHSFFNKPVTQTDPLGWSTTNYYDAAGNLLRQADALGTITINTYTEAGLVESQTDANGNVSTFGYDANGFRILEVDPAGFATRYRPNDVGWTLAMTNALGEVTTYAYNVNGNLLETIDPLSRVFRATYDANGNRLTHTDARGQVTRFVYDVLNRKTMEVDRANGTNRFAYTARGKPAYTTNAVGAVITYLYDAANRRTNVIDPLGKAVVTVFDSNGNDVLTIDQLGRRWKKTFDRQNRVVAEADPFGRASYTAFDPAGRVRDATDPNGAVKRFFYDGRGRLIRWVEPNGSQWRYDYDCVGNITNITDALGGNYIMVYGNRNERVLERNQDGKEWRYTYDPLERLRIQEEPNNTSRTLEYDPGGRVLSVTFDSGRVNSFLYDDNDNPVVLSRSGSGQATISQLGYDDMGRIQQYTDAFGKILRYNYDPAGRLQTLTYPDGKVLTNRYDALNRLTNQVFAFSPALQFATRYSYDDAGRLIRRIYPNGVVEENTFDEAGQIQALRHTSPGTPPAPANIGLHYQYDRNGNVTGCQEEGTFTWGLPPPRQEKSGFTPAARLSYRDLVTETNTSQIIYHYDNRGNMTNAAGAGQTWTLTYDEDNRATSMDWDPVITAKSVTNRYDAFGRRIARTVDGVQTGYVLDLVGSMERVLCDLNAARTITAWYVHGADLAFKVAADGKLTCYHSDAQGNVIAVTDNQASVLAQYAYTPYGRSLGSTNLQPATLTSQPYLFVGGQGVMTEEEGIPGLYFMRARYYLADAGVFLSTDPVQNIGPDWKPIAYAYGNCNPLRFNDPDGEFWNFVIGAVIGGGIDLFVQTVIEGKSLKEVNWAQVAGSAVAGALTGGIGSIGRVAAMQGIKALAANIAIGAISSAIGKGVEAGLVAGGKATIGWDFGGNDVSWRDVGISAATGAFGGALGTGTKQVTGKLNKVFEPKSFTRKIGEGAARKYAWRAAFKDSVVLKNKLMLTAREGLTKAAVDSASGAVKTGFKKGLTALTTPDGSEDSSPGGYEPVGQTFGMGAFGQ